MSWLRHLRWNPIPEVLGLNNLTNVKDKRLTAIRNEPEVFVLRIQHTRLSDSGRYECQVAPGSSSSGKLQPLLARVITLRVVGKPPPIFIQYVLRTTKYLPVHYVEHSLKAAY